MLYNKYSAAIYGVIRDYIMGYYGIRKERLLYETERTWQKNIYS